MSDVPATEIKHHRRIIIECMETGETWLMYDTHPTKPGADYAVWLPQNGTLCGIAPLDHVLAKHPRLPVATAPTEDGR